MPEISRFFGIVIQMYHDDHAPPHFHARYAGHKAMFAIDTLALLHGTLPPRALGLVMEWAVLHRQELMDDWNAARQAGEMKPIAPLE